MPTTHTKHNTDNRQLRTAILFGGAENAGPENVGPNFTRWHLQDWKMEDLDNKRPFKNAWSIQCYTFYIPLAYIHFVSKKHSSLSFAVILECMHHVSASTAFRRCTGTVWPTLWQPLVTGVPCAVHLLWYCSFLPDVIGRCLSFFIDTGTSANILHDFRHLLKRLPVSFYC